jgi:hypothetical protein
VPNPDSALRQAIAAAMRQSLRAQLSTARTARERQEALARIRTELDDVLANASSGADAMSDLRTRAMLATVMHEVAEEFTLELGATLDEEQSGLGVTIATSYLLQLRIPAGDLAALCARAKTVLTEARTKARRTKVALRSEAGLQHARRLEGIGLALLTVGELADVAADNEPGREVMVRREQMDVLRTVLDSH